MKLDGEIRVGPQGETDEVAAKEAEKFVATFFDKFKLMAGTGMGQIIDLKDSGLGGLDWPTQQQFECLDKFQKRSFNNQRVRCKLIPVVAAIDARIKGGFRSNYFVRYNYIGDGRCVLWWGVHRAKRPKAEISKVEKV